MKWWLWGVNFIVILYLFCSRTETFGSFKELKAYLKENSMLPYIIMYEVEDQWDNKNSRNTEATKKGSIDLQTTENLNDEEHKDREGKRWFLFYFKNHFTWISFN